MPSRERREGDDPQGSRHPRWPSLEEQLVRAKVRHGSKLEQLGKENQDFSILHPNEANNPLDYPQWLRVHWRKAHPEIVYSLADPSGGYHTSPDTSRFRFTPFAADAKDTSKPVWSPDGRSLAYFEGTGITRIVSA